MREIELAQLLPRRNDRVFVTGQTGSGKTTLVRILLQHRKYVVVLDVKGTMKWPGYTIYTKLDKVMDADPEKIKKIIYKPAYEDLASEYVINDFFKWVYERHNTTLYVDELAGVSNGNVYPYYYGACLMRGRELGIEVISGSQRPTSIPQIAMSEAEHVYAFKLRMSQDRARVESLTGVEAWRIAALQKREFLYAPQDGEIVGPIRLELGAGSGSGNNSLAKVS
jgi:energy-coupling factor transporter ATP-binding protein EcfA2